MPNIVILTGAGISAESGLQTFRDQDGLWCDHAIEDVATPQAFEKNPDLVHQFYNHRRRDLQLAKPNPAHVALAELEAKWEGEFTLVTQNVDDLHKRAGSQNLIHMHGELLKARCTKTLEVLSWEEDLSPSTPSPIHPEGRLRPHIVWFGEIPLLMDEIYQKLARADIFVSIGTSGQVYPAAGFAFEVCKKGDCELVEINLAQSEISHLFHKRFTGKASEKVLEWMATI